MRAVLNRELAVLVLAAYGRFGLDRWPTVIRASGRSDGMRRGIQLDRLAVLRAYGVSNQQNVSEVDGLNGEDEGGDDPQP